MGRSRLGTRRQRVVRNVYPGTFPVPTQRVSGLVTSPRTPQHPVWRSCNPRSPGKVILERHDLCGDTESPDKSLSPNYTGGAKETRTVDIRHRTLTSIHTTSTVVRTRRHRNHPRPSSLSLTLRPRSRSRGDSILQGKVGPSTHPSSKELGEIDPAYLLTRRNVKAVAEVERTPKEPNTITT